MQYIIRIILRKIKQMFAIFNACLWEADLWILCFNMVSQWTNYLIFSVC